MIQPLEKVELQPEGGATHSGHQVLGVNEAQVVGCGCDIFTVVNPQLGKQRHQLVVITHLSK